MTDFLSYRYFQNAEQHRFIPPIYEYGEDDDGEEYQYIANEEEYTRKDDLVDYVLGTDKPLYYFRRTVNRAKADVRYINSASNKVRAWRLGRRVVILTAEQSKKHTQERVEKLKW